MKPFLHILLLISSFSQTNWAETADNAPKTFGASESTDQVIQQAYSLRDLTGVEAIEDFNKKNSTNLEKWSGNFDFELEGTRADLVEPWLKKNFYYKGALIKELDLTKVGHPEIFSEILFDYIMEGWFNKNNQQNLDAQFRKNTKRTWCSTPWIVDGKKGREAVHGLTKELPMSPNPVYPADGVVLKEGLSRDEKPQGWGVALFNKKVCDQYNTVFGSKEKAQFPPKFKNFQSPNGFVSFKMHFNALPGWQKYKPLQGAYSWHAHVSDKSSSNHRTIKKIPLVQIGISFKDARLKGTRADTDNWVMLNYTFDRKFLNKSNKTKFLPQELTHMKPMGIQFGFEPEFTVMFDGAKSNYMKHGDFIPDGDMALLNGPADNPNSSCMSCHASGFGEISKAIQKEFSAEQFPGRSTAWKFSFYDTNSFQLIRKKYGKGPDFNLQMETADYRVQSWLKTREQ